MVGRPKTARQIKAEKLVEDFPDTPNRTLAKRLAAEFNCPLEQARSQIRYARGNFGGKRRKHSTTRRPNGKAGWKPKMPPSLSETWEPFTLGAKRAAVISDVHIPYHSELAFGVAVDWCKRAKVDTLLINGDFADFYTISRFQKDPRKRDFKTEIHLIKQGLEWLRHEFPKARIVWKLGNHEERWQHYLWNHAPEICDLEQVQLDQVCKIEDYSIELVDDQRPILMGELPVLHGHELPRGLSSPVNQARGAFMRTCHTVLVGHGHRTSTHAEPDMFGHETVCWSTGCLCELHPEYARINKWNWGFAFAEISSDGQFDITNLRITRDGKVRAS